jgi:hypothetical protein
MTAGLLAVCSALVLGGCQGQEDIGGSDRKPQLQVSETPTAPDLDAEVPERSVLLSFNDLEPGDPVSTIENFGALTARARVISADGGRIFAVKSPRHVGVRLPAYSATDPRFAMIGVFNTGEDDPLSPDEADFLFSADFAIDAVSTGNQLDNGDNLVARGLFEGASQYKIQVDGGRLSCRVAGLGGEVLVFAKESVQPGQWYRARCVRQGDTVTLDVAKLDHSQDPDDQGELDWASASETGTTGAVVMASTVPMAVGGKLSGDGKIFPVTTDQFNGRIDRVIYRLLG